MKTDGLKSVSNFAAILTLVVGQFTFGATTAAPKVATTQKAKASAVAPSPWRLRLSDRTDYNVSDAKNGINDGLAWTIGRVTYAFNPRHYLMAGGDVLHSWGFQSNSKMTFLIQDPYLEFGDNSVAKFLGGTNLKLAARIFAPLSVDSRDSEKIGELRTYVILNRDFSKWFNLAAISDARFYAQNWTTFINDKGAYVATKSFGWLYFLEGTFTVNEVFSFYQDVGAMDFWYNTDTTRPEARLNQGRQSILYYETAANIQFNKNWSLSGGITSADRDLRNQNTNFAIFEEKEMSYFLQGRVDF
jgi:hypothetical protein